MPGPIYLGIKTQNPVLGVPSTNPGTANAMAAAQQMAQSQQPPQPQAQAQQQAGRWNQGQGVPVIEVPWHKATPAMKNIK
jgi:hypothetical protein